MEGKDLSVARRIIPIPEMPLLATGKTDYVGLQALLEGDTFTRLLAAAGANPEQPKRPAATSAPPSVST